jgi:hypothetical protein
MGTSTFEESVEDWESQILSLTATLTAKKTNEYETISQVCTHQDPFH